MTTSVQRRRGSSVQHTAFTGLEGEITVDTTKDTAVVHDGSTVGGFPLAKESLENAKTTNLTAIIGTDTASDDTFLIYDASASEMKKITRAELNNAIEVDALSNVTITGGSINGTSIGATVRSSGKFTTLESNSTTTLDGTLIPTSKTLLVTTDIGTSVQGYDADLTTLGAGGAGARTFLGLGTAATTDATAYATAAQGAKADNALTTNNPSYTGTLTGGTGVVNLGSGQFYKDASGNVGIGVTPAFRLDVGGQDGTNIALRSTGTTAPKIRAYVNGSESGVIGFLSGGGQYFETAGTERMRIDSSGNVGIGTTNPTYFGNNALFVKDNGANPILGLYDVNGANRVGLGLYNGVANFGIWVDGSALTFRSSAGYSGGTERMRIDSGGNLLVGTTSSAYSSANRGIIQLNGTTNALIGLSYGGTNAGYVYCDAAGNTLWAEGSRYINIGVAGAGYVATLTNNTERMRIDSSGNLLVGTTTGDYHRFKKDVPGIIFQVENLYGSTSQTYRSSMATAAADTASYHFVGNCQANGDRVYIYGNGNIVNSNNSYGALSDRVIKENIVDASPKLDALMQVKVRNYNLIADETKAKQIGVVAQELEEVFPSMIEIDGMSGHKQVKYSVFVPMLIKAIQEQQVMINELKAKVAALEAI